MEANNAQKMREALVKIEKMAHCNLCNVYPKYRDMFNNKIGGIEREARAALSTPPRNCDRFETLDEAKACFAKIRDFPPFMTSDENYNPHRAYAEWFSALSEWLMSEADEAQEGGNDGSK